MSVPSPVKSSLPAIFFTDEMKRPYPMVFAYAIAGAGKTAALGTLKDHGFSPLVIATEDGQTKGMSTLAHLHLPAIMIDELDQMISVTSELQANAKLGQLFYQGQGPFDILAVDSATGLGPMLEAAAIKVKGWSSGMIWDVSPGGGKDPRSAYPYIAEKGRQIVRKLMSLPVPLVLTCREQLMTEGESSNAKSYAAPELPGQKLPKELPGWPEATVRLRMMNNQRVMQTENEGDVVARVRLPDGARLPKFCKPDLGALVKLLQGNKEYIEKLKLEPQRPVQTPQQAAAAARQATPPVTK